MRGKGQFLIVGVGAVGITPAYAGKRLIFTGLQPIIWDHPRLCGEKRKLSRLLIFSSGSPPPMRGNAARCGEVASCSGITPAYAGKSCRKRRIRRDHEDHPRLCGEKMV